MLYSRQSTRLKEYDYSSPGAYFVTVCTFRRQCIFGEIINGKMLLNKYGKIVRAEWLRTFNLRPYLELDEFIVMPNHFHCILRINDWCRGTARRVPTIERFGKPTMDSLPTIIRSFKSAVTKRINVVRPASCQNVWQRNYYGHIIRNEKELAETREYIINNPAKWLEDRNNPLNL